MRLSKRLSGIQKELLNDLKFGVWYDVFVGQGTGGEELPEWFHRKQSVEMQTIRPMVERGVIDVRYIGDWPKECKFPQIRKIA